MSEPSHPAENPDAPLSAPKFSSFKNRGGSSSSGQDHGNGESNRDGGLVVPKFGSFRSKRILAPETSASRGRQRDLEHQDQASSENRRKRRRERSRSRSRSRDGHGPPASRKHERKPPLPDTVGSSVKSLYVTDTKGDPLITKLGGIDKSKIPVYRRGGRGEVLGTAGRLVIHRDAARDQFSLVMPGEGFWTSKNKMGLRSKIDWTRRPSFRVQTHARPSIEEEAEHFISLFPPRRGQRQSWPDENASSSSEEEGPNYRSIEGKAKASRDELGSDHDHDLDHASEIEDPDSSSVRKDERDSDPLKWKSIQLSRMVKENPNDISAWMELVDHQDALRQAGEMRDGRMSANAAHSFTEIKVGMLESALSHASNQQERIRILPRLMREGGKIWSSKKSSEKWNGLQTDEQHSFALWKEHLDYTMSSVSEFSFAKVRAMLVARLAQITDFTQWEASESERQEIASEAVYIFMRATRFLHDAGYKELAAAAWQALIELNLFRPRHGASFDHFQEFWDSEVARIGEAKARGFSHFHATGGEDAAVPDSLPAHVYKLPESRDPYKAWGSLEELQAKHAELPARTMDEGNDDDPYRVVLFDDVRPYLFIIPEDVIDAVRLQLIDGFLMFCGLSPMVSESAWTTLAAEDSLMRIVNPPKLKQRGKGMAPDAKDDDGKAQPDFTIPLLKARWTDEVLFAGTGWFHSSVNLDGTIFEAGWVSQVLVRLAKDAGMLQLVGPSLALCLRTNPGGLSKLSKTLMKLSPEKNGMYAAYACCAAAVGNRDDATKVLASAISLLSVRTELPKPGSFVWLMQKGAKDGEEVELLILLNHWCRLQLEWGHPSLAAEKLISVVKNTDGGNARSYFSRRHQIYLSDERQRACVLAAQCLVLLEYSTGPGGSEPKSNRQGDIAAAMALVRRFSIDYQAKRWIVTHECLLQWAANLLYTHTSHGPYRRAYAQDQVHYFLSFFPHNSIFLGLYEWFDTSLRVVDETRSLLQERVLVTSDDGISSRVFAIRHELSHGSVHSARHAFEQSLSSDACRSNVGIWIWYLGYCVSEKELRSKAKGVFYRALTHCPWSKAVMMEAFITLNREMESRELRSVHETMETKGIRIHADWQAFMKTWKRREASNR